MVFGQDFFIFAHPTKNDSRKDQGAQNIHSNISYLTKPNYYTLRVIFSLLL